MKKGTLDKLLERMDRFDGGELQNFLVHLAKQRGLFREVFEVLQEGLILLDQNGELIFANAAVGKLLQKDAMDIKRSDIDHLLGHEEALEIILTKGAAISHDVEISYPEHRFLNLYIAPVSTDNTAYVILIRDVTNDHVDKEIMLETEQLNALTLLAAGVAHEIGNPLNSIGLHLQLLDRKVKALPASSDCNPDSLSQLIETALGETKRLDTILKQFLQAVRPSKPERDPLRLDPLIVEILEVLRPELESRNISVELNLTPNPPLIALDPTQIKQALYNLIKNAYQALPTEGGRIVIATEFNAYEVGLAVSDSGTGISPEVMGSIYEPFLTTKKSGTGLGLLIVRRIIKEHGGSMTIASQQGEGTTITLIFPRFDKPLHLLTEKES